MMTVDAALHDRVRFLRRPEWLPGVSLELYLLPGGLHGPWAYLHDHVSTPEPYAPIPIPIWELTKDTTLYEAAVYTIGVDGKSITHHVCGMTSHNLNDVTQHYCGACKVFLDA